MKVVGAESRLPAARGTKTGRRCASPAVTLGRGRSAPLPRSTPPPDSFMQRSGKTDLLPTEQLPRPLDAWTGLRKGASGSAGPCFCRHVQPRPRWSQPLNAAPFLGALPGPTPGAPQPALQSSLAKRPPPAPSARRRTPSPPPGPGNARGPGGPCLLLLPPPRAPCCPASCPHRPGRAPPPVKLGQPPPWSCGCREV